jgi:hypothetical protein
VSPRAARALFAALLLVQVAALWIVPVFPSQDGPSHVYNARLMLELGDPASFQVRQAFAFNPELHPNLAAHALLAGLQLVVDPLVAEKVVVTLVVALLPLALASLRRAAHGTYGVAALAGLLYAAHKLVYLGFYAFALGISLAFLALGFWWRRRERLDLRAVAGLYALMALAWAAHFAAFSAALLAIAVSAGWRFLLAAPSGLGPATRGLAAHALLLLPAGLVAVEYTLGGGGGGGLVSFPDAEKLWGLLTEDLGLASFTRWHDRLPPVVWATLVAAGAAGVALRGRPRLREADALLAIALVFLALFAFMPKFATGGGRINERMLLFAVLFAFAWLPPLPRLPGLALGAVLLALFGARLGRVGLESWRLQPELAAFQALAAHVAPHSTVAWSEEGQVVRAFPEGLRYVGPLRHADSYLARARDVALFANYEVTFPYFPIRRGEAPYVDPDYVLAWTGPGAPPPPDAARYEVARAERDLVLWRRRAAAPDASGWERSEGGGERLRLPAPAEPWSPGGRGWVRLAPRVTRPDVAAVGDTADRTFRADLPNGRYRVALELAAPATGRFELDVFANGAHAVRALAVGAGEPPPPARFDVEVSGERLLIVLHVGSAPVTAPWGLRAIEIERTRPDGGRRP